MRDHLRSSVETLGGSPLWLARFAGVGVLIATLVVGVNVTIQAESDAVWLFLLAVTTPLGLGFLALVTAEAMPGGTTHRSAVILGRLAGVAVLIAAVAVIVRFGTPAGDIRFWWTLRIFTLQVGIACLVLLGTEVLRQNRGLRIAVILGRLAGVVVVLASVGVGIRFAVEGGDSVFWVFLLWATTPVAFGVLVLVATEVNRGHRPDGRAVILGRAAGGLLIIASLAVAIRFSVEDAGGAWSLVPKTSTQLGLAFLVLVLSESMRRERDQVRVLLWGRWFGAIVVLAALASGLRFAVQSTHAEILAFLETVTTPIAVALIVVVSAEAIRGGIRRRSDSDQDLEVP